MQPSKRVLAVCALLARTDPALAGLSLVRPMTGGVNDAWLAESASGLAVIKVLTDADGADLEARPLALWGDAGVVPALLAFGATPAPYIVTRFANSTPVPAGAVLTLTAPVVAAAATLHQVPVPAGDDWPYRLRPGGGVSGAPERQRADGAPSAHVQLASAMLALLADQDAVLVHGDTAPWNVLRTRAGVVLLDPMAGWGSAALDAGRWCATAALTAYFAQPCDQADVRLETLLLRSCADAAAAAARAGEPLVPEALAAATTLELLAQGGAADQRWPAGYKPRVRAAAAAIAP